MRPPGLLERASNSGLLLLQDARRPQSLLGSASVPKPNETCDAQGSALLTWLAGAAGAEHWKAQPTFLAACAWPLPSQFAFEAVTPSQAWRGPWQTLRPFIRDESRGIPLEKRGIGVAAPTRIAKRSPATPTQGSAVHPILAAGSSHPCARIACIALTDAASRSRHQHPTGSSAARWPPASDAGSARNRSTAMCAAPEVGERGGSGLWSIPGHGTQHGVVSGASPATRAWLPGRGHTATS